MIQSPRPGAKVIQIRRAEYPTPSGVAGAGIFGYTHRVSISVEEPHRVSSRSPEYALLGFLYEKPNYGYLLHQALTGELGHVWHVSQSQTYNILNRLEAQKFISSTVPKNQKLPARQILHITAAGRQRFEAWLEAPPSSSVHAIRLEFITRLYFSSRLFPSRMESILEAQSEEVSAAIRRLKANLPGVPQDQTFNRLSLNLRIHQLQAVREWIRGCRKSLFPKRQA